MADLEPMAAYGVDPHRTSAYNPLDAFYNPGQATAVFDEGPLEKEKLALCGVPHVITKVTYHADEKFPKGYITCHGVIGPEELLQEAVKRGWVGVSTQGGFTPYATREQLVWTAGEAIKYNDGSTGIRRQVTGMLHNLGVIDVGTVASPDDFDRHFTDWVSFSQHSFENDKTGEKMPIPEITQDAQGRPLVIVARHGLRASWMKEYETNVFYLS